MCGIAGYFGSHEVSKERIDSCTYLMRQRGPDGNGYFHKRIDNNITAQILHSRLSIIDLDQRSNQPFKMTGGCLGFNGEIYNYLEIKNDLKKRGEHFYTNSDTEVLAKVLEIYGEDGLDLCEGMWSFAWLNEDRLMLSRDRFGEKPLFTYNDKSGFYFGSEPKYIFALLGKKLPINRNHLKRYLVNGYKSLYKNGETFFVGLNELPPGSVLELSKNGDIQQRKYWKPDFNQQKKSMIHSEAIESAREALINSVGLRLRSDVPIAFCLSGGIDSNALISIAKKHFKYDVHGFTVMNQDSRYEELDMVESSVQALGLKHTSVPIDRGGFLENLRTLVKYHDSPIATITYYAQWQLMSEISAAGYKVSVSGTAADELFSGYFDHHNFYIQSLNNNPKLQDIARENWRKFVSPIVRNPYLQNPDCFIEDPDCREHIFLDAKFFSTFLVEPWKEQFHEVSYTDQLLRNRMNNELMNEIVPVILHESDLNSMYFSIENRSPFLDKNLFNICQQIPTELLISNGKAKDILREAVRGLAPDIVLDNPRKVGFNVPILDYLDLGDASIRKQILEDSPIFDVVNREAIKGPT